MSVRLVVAAAQGFRVLLAVCHVLRYTPHMVTLQRLSPRTRSGPVEALAGP